MIGVTLVPTEPVVGGGGAVAGLIAVHIVELIQSWKIVPNPGTALHKLLAVLMLLLISGTLPQVGNYLPTNYDCIISSLALVKTLNTF